MHTTRPCPDSALLAAFIEGGLSTYERTAVVTHLAECDQCRSVAVGVVGFQEVQSLDLLWERPARQTAVIPIDLSTRRRWSRRGSLAASLLAAAAVLTVLIVPFSQQTSWFERQPLADLVDATREARTTEARVSGGFDYAPYVPADRTTTETSNRGQLLSVANRIRDNYEHVGDARSRQALGVAALLVGEMDEGVTHLAIAAAAAPNDIRLANDLAAAYYERARRLDRADDLPRALSAVERALAISSEFSDARFNRALIITALGLENEARTAWADYLKLDSASSWSAEARERLKSLEPNRDPARAWPTLRKALDTNPSASTAELAVRLHASRAREYLEIELLARWVAKAPAGDDGKVVATMRVLADAFLTNGGDSLYADLLTVIDAVGSRRDARKVTELVRAHHQYLEGTALLAANDFASAAPRLMQAATQLASAGSPLALRAEIELAGLDYYSARYEKAHTAVSRLKGEVRRSHSVLFMRATWLQGLVAYAQSDYALAQRAYEEQLDAATQAGDIEQITSARLLLANLHLVLGDHVRAWQYRIDAASSVNQLENAGTVAAVLLSAAGDADGAGNHAAALMFATSALTLDRTMPLPTRVQGLSQRARTFYQLDRHDEARRDVDRAYLELAAVREPAMLPRVEPYVLAADAEVFQTKHPARAITAAQRALSLPTVQRDSTRVARFNLWLANAYLAVGDVELASAAVQDGIAALDVTKNQPIKAVAAGLITASDLSWGLYVKGIDLALRRGEAARAFEYSERRRIRTLFERRQWGDRVLSLDQLQRGMPADTAVAVLNQLDDQLQVWVVRRDHVATHNASVSLADASNLVASHLHEVASGTGQSRISAELFDTVIRPVKGALQGVRMLVVITDAPYTRVAFAALWDRSRDRYLIEDHAIVAAPSATAYAWALTRGARLTNDSGRAAVILESPTGHEDSGGHRRRDDMAAGYATAEFRRGDAATPTRLLADARLRDVVHLAAPMVSNDAYPALSRLLLADADAQKYSGGVFAEHLAATDLSHAQLIALEATTGRSIPSDGRGTLGLISALLAAGVPNVVGPIADVTPSNQERTWFEFHRHYAGGLSAAESLRLAQLSALRESNRRPGPWALLAVFGSTQ